MDTLIFRFWGEWRFWMSLLAQKNYEADSTMSSWFWFYSCCMWLPVYLLILSVSTTESKIGANSCISIANEAITAWKAFTEFFLVLIFWSLRSKYGVFSGPYFPIFGQNTEIYSVNLRILSECRKIWTRKTSIFGHFSGSEINRPFIFLSADRAGLLSTTFELCY